MILSGVTMDSKNNVQKKVLILGGKAVGSVDIVQYLKQGGYYVIVTDFLEKEKSPAKMFADETLMISTGNIDELASYVMKNGVSAVFTGIHDFNIQKCLELCEKTQLPFYSTKECFDIAFNKRKYKDIFKQFGIPVIPEYIFSYDNIAQDIEYPIILKPVDSCGAYGIQLCYSQEEVKHNLQKTLEYSNSKKIIAEKYIEDKDEITIVYIIKDGVPYLASVADRIVKGFENCIIPLPIAYKWNSRFLDLYEQEIDEKMRKAIRYMGLPNGMLFIQAIVKDNVMLPYDIGYRLSATQEHIVIEAVCGYNPLKLLVDYAVSGRLGDETLVQKINPHFPYPAGQVTFLVKPERVHHFEGIEAIEKMEGVIRVVKNKLEGEVIPESAWGTLNLIALRVFLIAPTEEKLHERMQLIRNSVKIFSYSGENIVI